MRDPYVTKIASAYSDMLFASLLGKVGLKKYPAETIGLYGGGSMLGALAPAPDTEGMREMDRNAALALVPGMPLYRLMARRKGVRRFLNPEKKSRGIPAGELLGSMTSTLGSTLAGAGIGAGIGYRNSDTLGGTEIGAMAGLGTGAALNLAGLVAAALTKRRTLREQEDYENKRHLSNWLMPGASTYNFFKGIGAANTISQSKDDKELKKKYDEGARR